MIRNELFYIFVRKIKVIAYQNAEKTVRWVVGIVLGVYIGTIVLLNIPNIQQAMSVFVAEELSEVLNTKVVIGRINIGLLNRIIIDDVLLDDQSGQEMLKVTRLSAKFDIMPFLKERYPLAVFSFSDLISIS